VYEDTAGGTVCKKITITDNMYLPYRLQWMQKLHERNKKKTSTVNIQMVKYYTQDYISSGPFPPSNVLNRTQYFGNVMPPSSSKNMEKHLFSWVTDSLT
jgi:hypothetical protein